MNVQTASILRTILKVGGSVLITKGYTDSAGLEATIGVVIALIGAGMSYFHHASAPKA